MSLFWWGEFPFPNWNGCKFLWVNLMQNIHCTSLFFFFFWERIYIPNKSATQIKLYIFLPSEGAWIVLNKLNCKFLSSTNQNEEIEIEKIPITNQISKKKKKREKREKKEFTLSKNVLIEPNKRQNFSSKMKIISSCPEMQIIHRICNNLISKLKKKKNKKKQFNISNTQHHKALLYLVFGKCFNCFIEFEVHLLHSYSKELFVLSLLM